MKRKYRKHRVAGMLLLIIGIIFYVFGALAMSKSLLTYTIVLLALSGAIVFINDFNFVSPQIIFLAYYLYSIGIGPIILMSRKTYFPTYNYLIVILGGLACFALGNALFAWRNFKPKSQTDRSKILIVNIDRITVLYIGYTLTLLLSAYYVLKNRAYLFSGSLESSRMDAMTGNGMLIYCMQSVIVILPMLYDIYFESSKFGKPLISKNRLFMMTAISSVALLATGFRAPIATLYICIIVMYAAKTNRSNGKIVLYGFIAVLGVTLLGVARTAMSGGTSKVITSLLTSMYVSNINLHYVFSTFPSMTPFQHGYTYFINFIMLLPGPDLDFTMWLKEQAGIMFSGGGLTPTILGEFYLNFGFNAIFIGMFILGVYSVFLNRYFVKHKESFFAVFLVWQFAHLITGGIANVEITVFLYGFLYKLILMFDVTDDYELKIDKGIDRWKRQKI